MSAIMGERNLATSSSGLPFLSPVLFLLLLLLSAPQLMAAPRIDYNQCMADCETAFPNVVQSETSCAHTLTSIHYDMGPLRDFLLSDHRCRGRFRKACMAWKKQAIGALERLSSLTLGSHDCRSLDAQAIASESAIFDAIISCRGDGKVTDFHDLLGRKRSYINKINAKQPRYKVTLRRFGTTPGEGGRSPQCSPGDKPRAYYLWPLLQFRNALVALAPYQHCISQCRKPTEGERALWHLEETFPGLMRAVKARAAAGQVALDKHLAGRVRQGLPDVPCHAITVELELSRKRVERLQLAQARLAALLALDRPPEPAVEALVAEVTAVAAAHDVLEWGRVKQECLKVDASASLLDEKRHAILVALALGDPFSLKAVETFRFAGKRGAACQWTGECQVPLQCQDKTCQGIPAASRSRPT